MQGIMQAITHVAIKATRAGVRAMMDVAELAESSTMKNQMGTGPKASGPQLGEPTVNWSIKTSMMNWKTLRWHEQHIMTKNYDVVDIEKCQWSVIGWLERDASSLKH